MQPYIVYLGEPPSLLFGSNQTTQHLRVVNSHFELLGSILGTRKAAQDAIFYSYTHNINGFAAKLDKETADKISKYLSLSHCLESDGTVGSNSLWTKAQYGKDTIIGNLDTGVWPESDSFADEAMGDIPSAWKGICQNDVDTTFTCNKKLIGARYFNKGYEAYVGKLNSSYMTPRDNDGHGTHTLSTAGGAFVANASLFGYGTGTAKGGSPKARVAAYKVCWPPLNGGECFDSDILAAFDAAISDGVDVVSMSVGGDPVDYFNDGIAIGSFHATLQRLTGRSIVICTRGSNARVAKGEAVLQAGGVGMVLINSASTGNEIIADAHVLPATHITFSDGQTLLSCLKSNSIVLGNVTNPETVLNTKPAPFMAAFSSQGPNTITPGILKPDITAPGVSVIAAYTGATSPTGLDFDTRRVKFNSESGHVNPNAAADPGLIYDFNATDYLNFLCSIRYTPNQLASFQQGYKCPSPPINTYDFNYPSFTIYNLTSSVTVTRTVKNVGPAGTYTAKVEEPKGISIKVDPNSLKFAAGEEKTFKVTFNVSTPSLDYVFGSITWSDANRKVRSPVVVLTSS
ncbi:Subtilisin-like protease family protein [Rhynchospora pubera]|uniref:Subtilisin-like protease family protein n=1 Tax=Rhynchospora pubera TaxID=906938 RepID=A0AAV8G0J3_9POAL|nr:Subtilisin-like protease family protein [Rhynchospora pubera]